MPQCLAIQDTVTGLWLTGYSHNNVTWGNSVNAICFPTEAQRQVVLDELNQGQGNRYVGAVPPPPK